MSYNILVAEKGMYSFDVTALYQLQTAFDHRHKTVVKKTTADTIASKARSLVANVTNTFSEGMAALTNFAAPQVLYA